MNRHVGVIADPGDPGPGGSAPGRPFFVCQRETVYLQQEGNAPVPLMGGSGYKWAPAARGGHAGGTGFRHRRQTATGGVKVVASVRLNTGEKQKVPPGSAREQGGKQ